MIFTCERSLQWSHCCSSPGWIRPSNGRPTIRWVLHLKVKFVSFQMNSTRFRFKDSDSLFIENAFFKTLLILNYLKNFQDLPSTGNKIGTTAGKQPTPVTAGGLSDADLDIEARLENLRRQWCHRRASIHLNWMINDYKACTLSNSSWYFQRRGGSNFVYFNTFIEDEGSRLQFQKVNKNRAAT